MCLGAVLRLTTINDHKSGRTITSQERTVRTCSYTVQYSHILGCCETSRVKWNRDDVASLRRWDLPPPRTKQTSGHGRWASFSHQVTLPSSKVFSDCAWLDDLLQWAIAGIQTLSPCMDAHIGPQTSKTLLGWSCFNEMFESLSKRLLHSTLYKDLYGYILFNEVELLSLKGFQTLHVSVYKSTSESKV